MQLRIFTLPYSPQLSGFDDGPVREFISDKEQVRLKTQFFIKEGQPHWTVMVRYNDSEDSEALA